jgi:hypothetical protein
MQIIFIMVENANLSLSYQTISGIKLAEGKRAAQVM